VVGGGALALTLVPAGIAQAETFKVTSKSGSPSVTGSLPFEITQANTAGPSAAPDVITFASNVTGSIDLSNPLPEPSYALDIKGPGARVLTLNASGNTVDGSILYADSGQALKISGLSMNDANSGSHTSGFIYANHSPLTIDDDSFSDDSGNANGGAVQENGDALVIDGSTFAHDSSARGGAVYARGSGNLVTIEDSTFVDNRASYQGGGLGFSNVAPTIIGTTITGNTVEYTGDDTTTHAGYGGGIAVHGGPLTVKDSIVAGNDASGNPDYVPSGGRFPTNYTDVFDQSLNGSGLTLDFSLVRSDTSSFTSATKTRDIFGKSPDLGPLQNNGGPTNTELPAADSPVINAGQAFGLTTDQRGLKRIVDFPGVSKATGGDAADMGAVELQPYITGLSKSKGKKGAKITIHGSGFRDARAVRFGSTKAKKFKVVSDTEITVTVPKGKRTVAVTVSTPAGKSPEVTADRFKYS
jgi:hypothetical protein